MLSLQGLDVYEKALPLAASAEKFSANWGKRHAVVDHFRRAAESIVLNIAEGARLQGGPNKARMVDFAIGSTFECAACLDIATIKGRLTRQCCHSEKSRLVEITRMLVGLRKRWLPVVMKEEPNIDFTEPSASECEVLFHHESLDVYQVALEFMRWFVDVPGGRELSERLCREIDRAATSVVLNVAEGNGRYSVLDHRRFLEIAATSATKATAYLDLYQQRAEPGLLDIGHGRELMGRIIAMIAKY